MMNPNFLTGNLFEKIFELNSKSKIGATTITVFTFILYKCEDPQKKIVLSDYEMARELGLSRQTVITAKNKLKLLGLLEYKRNPGFPNRFILNGNEFPNEKLKIYEIKEIPAEKFNPIQSPKNVASNSQSKHPTLMQFMDLRESERKTIKGFFDDNEGYNKIRFAKKYVELLKVDFFKDIKPLKWIEEIKKRINN